CVPATDSEADRRAAWASDGYVNRWYLDPLTGRGYPEDTRRLWERVLAERRPGFALEDWISSKDEALIGRRLDFIGVNYYTRRVCAAAATGPDHPFPWDVVGPTGDVPRTDEGWEIVPEALRDLLVRLHRDYDGRPAVVTENGAVFGDAPTHDGRVHDVRRVAFIRDHLTAVREAMAAGADVRGYMHWSLLDNFEWALGYRPRFGLTHVDYASGARTLKDSALFYGQVALTNTIPPQGPEIRPYG
ncbi:MAG: family 1 glycosylhydrolase, partial [Bifidobacteriaceae bacterium]|nr:family 1 glycosylhydrolase [Bifidobacteriaceae bacterium]